LTSLTEKLTNTSAKIVSHCRYVAFRMAEIAVPRHRRADSENKVQEIDGRACRRTMGWRGRVIWD
jgi:hypothetical protein